MINKARMNFAVDTIAFVCFAFLATTGVLLKFILLPGSGRAVGEGLGRGGATRDITVLWNLTRHEWGNIHFWISVTLLAVLSLHLVLHWRWIYGILKGPRGAASGFRFAVGAGALMLVLFIAALPLFAPTQRVARLHLQSAPTTSPPDNAPAPESESESIRGSMTLREASQVSGVPMNYLLENLKLPTTTDADEKIGRLSRRQGFNVEQLRIAVKQYQTQQNKVPGSGTP